MKIRLTMLAILAMVAGLVAPAFAGTLTWSEYPSWSIFGVADAMRIIDGEEGKQGPIEKKHGVDLVLKLTDYDTCLTLYGGGIVQAICMTNMDSLPRSLRRDSVVLFPTSRSHGSDGILVTKKVKSLDDLRNHITYGLESSVSQFAFIRIIENHLREKGLTEDQIAADLKNFRFANMDPAAAAQALQTNQANINSIIVWEPFLLQTMRKRDDIRVVADSSSIPNEIIDLVVVSKQTLGASNGEAFANALADTYYEVCRQLRDPKRRDKITVAIGQKFSTLGLEDMRAVLTRAQLYDTPQKARELFADEKWRTETTPGVTTFCQQFGIVKREPTVGFEQPGAQLNYTLKYIDAAIARGGNE